MNSQYSGNEEELMPKVIEGQLIVQKNTRFGIAVARTNSLITERLLEGALDCLLRHGAADGNGDVAICGTVRRMATSPLSKCPARTNCPRPFRRSARPNKMAR